MGSTPFRSAPHFRCRFRFRCRSFLLGQFFVLLAFLSFFPSLSFLFLSSTELGVFYFVSFGNCLAFRLAICTLGPLSLMPFPLVSSRPRTGAATAFLTWIFFCEIGARTVNVMNIHTQLQEREREATDGASERRVGGTGPVESSNSSVGRESIAAAGNHVSQQQVASPSRETCRNREDSIDSRDRRTNAEGVLRGKIQENEQCSDRMEEVDEIEVGCRKRKRRDSVSPLSRLIRSCRRSSNH